ELAGKPLTLNLSYTQILATQHPVVAQALVREGALTWTNAKNDDADEEDESKDDESRDEEDDATPNPQAEPPRRNVCTSSTGAPCAPAFLLHFKLGQGRVTALGNGVTFMNAQ